MARELVEARLAACVQVGAPVESLYHWRGPRRNGQLRFRWRSRRAPTRGPRPGTRDPRAPSLRTSGDRRGPPHRCARPTTSPGSTRRRTGLTALAGSPASMALVGDRGGRRRMPPGRSSCRPNRPSGCRRARSTRRRSRSASTSRTAITCTATSSDSPSSPRRSGRGTPALPPGKPHQDEFFGKVTTYRGLVVIRLPLAAGRRRASTSRSSRIRRGAPTPASATRRSCQRVTLTLPDRRGGPHGRPSKPTPPKKPYFN